MKKTKDAYDAFTQELLKDYNNPDDLSAVFTNMKRRIVEAILQGELDHTLNHAKHERTTDGNYRNGSSNKTIHTDTGSVEISIPRDRNGEHTPLLVKKHQNRLHGIDDQILAMYSRGLSMRDIQSQLYDIYGMEISHEFVSNVTDKVMEEVVAWQSRPLEKVYPIVYLDAMVVKIKADNRVSNHSVYLATAINMEGHKDVLGIWIAQTEGAKFWLTVLNDLKNRGVEDIFIACVDGLKGFPEAINTAFPKTTVQLCIVHILRNCFRFVPCKDRKAVAEDLKPIYTAVNQDDAELALMEFKNKWDEKYPSISDIWSNNWQEIIPFLAYPPEIRKVIYTTNIAESINRQIRKVIKTKGSFPDENSVKKIIYLCLTRVQKKWTMPIRNWVPALNQFAIFFADRINNDGNFKKGS